MVFVIAEAGVNHNGSVERAREMVAVAAEAGADAVKFQTFDPDALVSAEAPKAAYQDAGDGAATQREMLQKFTLTPEEHLGLRDQCEALGIAFMSTAFDMGSLAFLTDDMGLDTLKVGSGDLDNAPLLYATGKRARRLILSTGMGEEHDVAAALGIVACGALGLDPSELQVGFDEVIERQDAADWLRESVTVLQCTTAYPTPDDQVNLAGMDFLAERFGLSVGFSDHSKGIDMAIAAAGRGACVIEKHFTLDRSLPGPDHAASLEPQELRDMVQAIRRVEKGIGTAAKQISSAEAENLVPARRSLVAARDIRKGELFSEENLAVKRPGGGRSPRDYWRMLGQPANRDYGKDSPLD